MPNKEQFTNGATTTLASAMAADHTTLTVTSALLFPTSGQFRIRIDNEVILATRTETTAVFGLTRAQEGTTATSHASGAAVTQILTAGALDSLVSVYDEGSHTASTRLLDFRGPGVSVALTAGTATVTVSDTVSLEVRLDGSGSAIGTGVGWRGIVPCDLTLTDWTCNADQVGSLTVDLWVDTQANYPPTDADSITGTLPVALAGTDHGSVGTISGWTVALSKGQAIWANVDSASTITQAVVLLSGNRR